MQYNKEQFHIYTQYLKTIYLYSKTEFSRQVVSVLCEANLIKSVLAPQICFISVLFYVKGQQKYCRDTEIYFWKLSLKFWHVLCFLVVITVLALTQIQLTFLHFPK